MQIQEQNTRQQVEFREGIYQLSLANRFIKRSFDLIVGTVGMVVTLPIILISALLVRICYGESGFFVQQRVGKGGKLFKIIKIKTMTNKVKFDTTVTTDNDPRITKLGRIYRKTKIDELPQLINVVKGDMSFVGPRPDVKEVVDTLTGVRKSMFLSVRPGITGPASIKYKNEEDILAGVDNPEVYSVEVIFKDKVDINIQYIRSYSLVKDIKYIVNTVI